MEGEERAGGVFNGCLLLAIQPRFRPAAHVPRFNMPAARALARLAQTGWERKRRGGDYNSLVLLYRARIAHEYPPERLFLHFFLLSFHLRAECRSLTASSRVTRNRQGDYVGYTSRERGTLRGENCAGTAAVPPRKWCAPPPALINGPAPLPSRWPKTQRRTL